MRSSLVKLFSLLDKAEPGLFLNCTDAAGTEELFADAEDIFAEAVPPPGKILNNENYCYPNQKDIALVSDLHSSKGIDFSGLPYSACRMYELSPNAFDVFVGAWMSELPLEEEMLRFGRKVIAANDCCTANRMACNRSDNDVRVILETANKVWHEIHRFQGFLRFAPDLKGRYIAHCEPDFFILPAFGEHFFLRFGKTPWAIIDDKRCLCLSCFSADAPELNSIAVYSAENHAQGTDTDQSEPDQWENLWKNYHQVINNACRENPALQRQLMPKRYWKNLPEMK